MRVSKIIPFLRPQDFEQEQYQSGVRMEQFISGYGKKQEQYISGYTASQGVAYQFKDASKVSVDIYASAHVGNALYSYSLTVKTAMTSQVAYANRSVAGDKSYGTVAFNLPITNWNQAINEFRRALVGGDLYIHATHALLTPSTLANTEKILARLSEKNTSVVGENIVYGNTSMIPIVDYINAGRTYGSGYFILETPISNLQLIEVGKTPIYSTREIEDKAKPIYSEREVPVYDYRWREISPK